MLLSVLSNTEMFLQMQICAPTWCYFRQEEEPKSVQSPSQLLGFSVRLLVSVNFHCECLEGTFPCFTMR